MPKRKRGVEHEVRGILEKFETKVFRALKASKGFERQRQSKRLREPDVTPGKAQRLEREITVLKSLDLHHIARTHLYLSLLKFKAIATSPDLPEELKRGVSKPDLPQEEQVAFHNVTSGLYNRDLVKQAIHQAVQAMCVALNVPVPERSSRSRKDTRAAQEAGASSTKEVVAEGPESAQDEQSIEHDGKAKPEVLSGDANEPGSDLGKPVNVDDGQEVTEFDELGELLGSSSDEEEEDWSNPKFAQLRGRETVNLDDISLSGSAEESGMESDEAPGDSHSSSPPPDKTQSKEKGRKTGTKQAQPGHSTFLPSLMGGYISGSESASDIEKAKPKKRRGQRARQAIWEKKYGSSARHLQKADKKGGRDPGRDSGWDMRRGAVDGDGQGGRRRPWKDGIETALGAKSSRQGEGSASLKPSRRDDEGTLHPSWEARKKAKESQKTVEFTGQKVVFE
ncbi:uncharacterized protein UV8b_07976 [Ustilaginoidea virens]|uniref:Bud22 domain-containing protein n=1 Tax=Ustilaginoidea virens TaxID=1159556 RepID=A0A063CDJ3_USTVR|nr:uncharacterized protein UV8b_07976 [Ustilaginoidea virens]QUC23735.1 hypothetical protein UV8b_07976 [Ustilaginoidea virens]GAO17665.1 hypothetical protein UVI_02002250 [Ustilaginoidea virens]